MISFAVKQLLADINGHFLEPSATPTELPPQLQALLASALERLDLVSRHEFDAQTAVLQRTHQKVEALEKQLAELENLVYQQT